MKKRPSFAVVCLSLFAAATSLHGAQPNLVLNGDFEAGNTGFSTSYTLAPKDIWNAGTYDIVSNPTQAHYSAVSFTDHTSGSGLMMAVNNSGSIGDVIWEQTVSVQANTLYEVSLFYANWNGTPPPVFRVEVNLDVYADVTQTGPSGVWNGWSAQWDSGSATAATLRVVNRSTALVGNDLTLDDISMTIVPEPSAGIALILAGGVFLVRTFRLRRD